jgi:hypothetical protein
MNERTNVDAEGSRSVLREIGDLCEHASLTGSMPGGEARVVQRYNSILAQLTEAGIVPAGMFVSLPEGSSYGEIGVEARMLAAYLRKERRRNGDGDPSVILRLAPFVSAEDLATLVREHLQSGSFVDMHMLTHLAPFLNKEDVGSLLHVHLKETRKPKAAGAPEAPPAPQPAAAPQTFVPEPTVQFEPTPPPAAPQEDRVSVLLERLKDPRLTDDERSELVDRIRRLTAGA